MRHRIKEVAGLKRCTDQCCVVLQSVSRGEELTTFMKEMRMGFRLAAGQKSLLEGAAHLSGLSLSDFVLLASVKGATGIMEQQRIVVSEQEYQRLIAALEADAPPTAAALSAAERFRKGSVLVDGTPVETSND